MGATETVDIALRADLSQLTAGLASIPGITEKEAKKMVASLGKEINAATAAAKKAAADTGTNWQAAGNKLSAALGGLSGQGKYVSGLKNIVEGSAELEASFGAMAPAAGVVALSIGAMAAGAVGVYEVGKALANAVLESDKLVDKLKPFRDAHIFPEISEEQIASIHEATGAYDAIGVVWDEITVQVGTKLAPTLLALEKEVIEAGLAISHMVNEAFDGIERMDKFRASLGTVGKAAFDLATMGLFQTIDGLKDVAANVGTADDAFADYGKTADDLIAKQTSMNFALSDFGKAAKDAATKAKQAYEELAAIQHRDMLAEYDDNETLDDQIKANVLAQTALDTKSSNEAFARNQKSLKDRFAAEKAIRDQVDKTREAELSAASAVLGSIQSITGTILAHAKHRTKAQKEGLMAVWVAQEAAGLAQAGVNAALAISAAGTLPPPANIPALIIAAAQGAASIAAVAAVPPPKFHKGRTPNEFSAVLDAREGVANPSTMTDPSFRADLAARNRGESPSGAGSTNVVFRGRVIDRMVADTLQAGGRAAAQIQRIVGNTSGMTPVWK